MTIDNSKTKAAVEADERLRAAAPELLVACRDASSVIANVLENLAHDLKTVPEPARSTAVGLLSAAAEQCRNAVAKAEGATP